jgi:hypothetical protein
MGLIDDIRQKGTDGRFTEEALYAEVLREMEDGIRRDGLWAKALSEAGCEEASLKGPLHQAQGPGSAERGENRLSGAHSVRAQFKTFQCPTHTVSISRQCALVYRNRIFTRC